jgi:hypothetical protein
MKKLVFLLGLLITLFSITPYTVSAAIEIHTPAANVIQKQSPTLHFHKLLKSKKGDVDLKHPVKKWLWLSLIFLLASVVFRAFKFGSFAYILGAVAFICLIVWFLKLVEVL